MFLLFCGDNYYPSGGVNDLVAIGSTLEEATRALPSGRDWAHVLEIEGGRARVVWTWGSEHIIPDMRLWGEVRDPRSECRR